MGNNISRTISGHDNVLIGDNVFVWGGFRDKLPQIHDSEEKRKYTTSVYVFDLLKSTIAIKPTTGDPHTGTVMYSSCNIGNDIYYFGGRCRMDGCYHNDLSVLNTETYKWRCIACDGDKPTKKFGSGMVPLNIDGEDYVVVIGGYGSSSYTNEIHMMCVSSKRTCKWTVPKRSGCELPLCAFFSVNVFAGSKAVLFGGRQQDISLMKDIYIMLFTKSSVDIRKCVKPSTDMWPEERHVHSSAVISSDTRGIVKHHLLVLGGWNSKHVTANCWIMDIESIQWQQVALPNKLHQAAAHRSDHSICSFMMSVNRAWLLITGGYNMIDQSTDNVMILELAYFNKSWTAGQVMNAKEIQKQNTTEYTKLVYDRLTELRREYHRSCARDNPWIEEIMKQNEQNCPWIIEADEVKLTNEMIGDGAYGEVKVAIFHGARIAAKCLHNLIVSQYNRSIFEREMGICSRIHHPNIVQFIGATRTDIPILLYELMPTSLHKRLQNGHPLTRGQIISICRNISSALCYLHLWRPDPIIHRDISSPNVLLQLLADNKLCAKLSDFGSANLQLQIRNISVAPGNAAYAAPEAITPQLHSPSMDIYSFGVLITEMVLQCKPEMDIRRRTQQANTIDWENMKSIVLRCISHERQQRPTAMELVDELNKAF